MKKIPYYQEVPPKSRIVRVMEEEVDNSYWFKKNTAEVKDFTRVKPQRTKKVVLEEERMKRSFKN